MVITKKDQDGRIIAYAEYRMVDAQGKDHVRGEYIWINDVWVHKDYRRRNVFNEILQGFIAKQALSYPWAKYIYWKREKHDERMSLYNRTTILRRVKNGEERGRGIVLRSGTDAHTGAAAVGCSV